jgi:hypothetical protein
MFEQHLAKRYDDLCPARPTDELLRRLDPGHVAISVGTAISISATKNSGHWNGVGRSALQSTDPANTAQIASAMNVYNASKAPPIATANQKGLIPNRRPHSIRATAITAPTQISIAMDAGASTGPHQGRGIRNNRSHPKSDAGQPMSSLRKYSKISTGGRKVLAQNQAPYLSALLWPNGEAFYSHQGICRMLPSLHFIFGRTTRFG